MADNSKRQHAQMRGKGRGGGDGTDGSYQCRTPDLGRG
jgi:hypothetical protein